MMNGRGKSDSAIVAGKPTNKAGQPAAESVEPSAEAEGNGSRRSTCGHTLCDKTQSVSGANVWRRVTIPHGRQSD